ncbi:MAG TPA: hypothetical protein ENI55_06525 [Alphaproteobacteria bacterium]|nr:hypothetical protein [Alphaproteobacteria bacterium]
MEQEAAPSGEVGHGEMTEQHPNRPAATARQVDAAYEAHFSDAGLTYCSADLAGKFLADVTARLSAHSADSVNRNFGPLLQGSAGPEAARMALRELAVLVNETGQAELFAEHDGRVIDAVFSDFVADVNEKRAGRGVVFVVHAPYFVILREAMYLRRNGYRVYLLSLGEVAAGLRELFRQHFDLVVDARGNYRLLRAILARLEPDIFHVQCWMWFGILGRMAMEAKKNAAVVCEFYDITSVYAAKEDLSPTWPPGVVEFEFAMERHIAHRADAVISRFPDWLVEEWGRNMGALPKYISMQAWPCAEFISYGKKKLSAADGVIRLVYAGGLVPENERNPAKLFPETNMDKAFQALLGQGMAIDVMHDPNAAKGIDDAFYGRYNRLAAEYPLFRFREGVSPDKLSDVLNGYDYGILLTEFDEDVVRISANQRKGAMATKIFAYLEAGLPVLVNAEYGEMARLVNEHGLGLAVHSRDLGNAAKILSKFDYRKAVANIKKFNESHSMESEIDRLIELYDAVISGHGEIK